MFACTDSATLFNTFAVLCTQHRWCCVPGKTSSSAFQKPSAPSPTAISGVIFNPRLFTSMRSSRQLCALSRTPTWKPMSSFLPSGVAPISTIMHSLWSSIRACRNTPSAHTYRYRRADKSRLCQCPYSPCHGAGRPAIPNLHAGDLDSTDPRLDRAFGSMTVPDNTVSYISKLEALHLGKKCLG